MRKLIMVPYLPGGRIKGIGGACKNAEGSRWDAHFFRTTLSRIRAAG
ncbi:hypothetical protein [Pontibacter sp. H249]